MLVAVILSFIALAANVVGLAIPYWLYSSVVHAGLWETCTKIWSTTTCISYGKHAVDSLKATQALEVIGMALLVAAVLCILLKLSVMRNQTKLPTIAGVLAICAGLAMIIGTIVYATKYRKQADPGKVLHLHAGFGLCITGGVLSIVTGVWFLLRGRGSGSYSEI